MSVEKILKRAAREIQDGQTINLGIGLPTMLVEYLPLDHDVMIHSENGVLGTGRKANEKEANPYLIDAGGSYVTTRPGAAFFDSAVSFAMIRRSKLDMSVMGAFEVDQEGNLANWKIPGKFSPGIGGAMELAQKTGTILILCTHTDKYGKSKILKKCTLPLTAEKCVSRIITDMAVMDVTPEGLVLREVAEGLTPEEVIKATDAELIPADTIGSF
ncbi:3-oxoacid CoA-transferase subunit B [Kordiimonas marina]|uniref:3-oxoacid CoA-transferase subunit B n=1 Tax=Kordiimonas marina TaxID=2872312 RepID=UPI001FF3BF97|nr:3-oxoacid CoA-transferase subunit B [Kordiimonas marina]MCJ9430078.1 3-oxoacid CoA-transferase subunit B [Kordiimonas marina]